MKVFVNGLLTKTIIAVWVQLHFLFIVLERKEEKRFGWSGYIPFLNIQAFKKSKSSIGTRNEIEGINKNRENLMTGLILELPQNKSLNASNRAIR